MFIVESLGHFECNEFSFMNKMPNKKNWIINKKKVWIEWLGDII